MRSMTLLTEARLTKELWKLHGNNESSSDLCIPRYFDHG